MKTEKRKYKTVDTFISEDGHHLLSLARTTKENMYTLYHNKMTIAFSFASCVRSDPREIEIKFEPHGFVDGESGEVYIMSEDGGEKIKVDLED